MDAKKKTQPKKPAIRAIRVAKALKQPPPTMPRRADGTFEKGVSGNPTGRPATYNDFKKLAQQVGSPAAFATLVRDLDCGDPRAEVQSAMGLLAYAWGKPTQAIEVSGPDGGPVKTEERHLLPELTLETARRLRAIADALQPQEGAGAGQAADPS